MKKYKVTLKSKDNNVLEYSCYAEDEKQAGLNALDNVKDKGWDVYEYRVKNIESIS